MASPRASFTLKSSILVKAPIPALLDYKNQLWNSIRTSARQQDSIITGAATSRPESQNYLCAAANSLCYHPLMRVKNVRPNNTEAATIERVFTHIKEHIFPDVEGNSGSVLVEFLGSRTELEDSSKKNDHHKKFISEEVILVLSFDLVGVGKNRGNPFANFYDTLTIYPGIDLLPHHSRLAIFDIIYMESARQTWRYQ
ncbi:unnamed protein product [Fusarium equiseti]|uniref:Uncharacterized protein n=1 Tax=Fusarium equiseti TaxID=61235 RepID=A0A8J2J3I6_FUSEQ|nr:unnamed protein product [Fusarium equiseti]